MKAISKFFLSLVLALLFILPTLVFAQENQNPGPVRQTGQAPTTITSPYSDLNFTLVSFLNFILNNIVLPIGAVIAVLFLVYAGFLFVTARGNETQLEKAKETFKWTVIGIAILFGSTVIATGIQNTICQIAPNIPSLCTPR